MTAQPLKLRAVDAADLEVISAVLQDAIVPVVDMLWQREEKRLLLMPQRLCPPSAEGAQRERICCALTLSGVEQLQTQSLDLNDNARMLDLLALMPEGDALHFIFAGGGAIRAKLVNWSLTLADYGEAWPAVCDPCHEELTG